MSLFSKLFGDSKNADDALNALKNAAKSVADAAEKAAKENLNAPRQNASAPAARPAAPAANAWEEDDPWEKMPEEENQYSFNGTYVQYFDKIFREAFPAYDISHAPDPRMRATVFTFMQGGRKALVVELKSENSSAQRLRNECQAAGIPYLRFYYDHSGWWNTRSYVEGRTRKALGE
ncbi:MAG: hypothetical protein IJJ85_03190 [Clostridia bacterium]|nr:hypothetical protein [Clostridia bacterium]